MKRPDVTQILTKAAVGYLVKIKFSCCCEIGVIKWGRRKVDVLALNMNSYLIICEVKSCASDYLTDQKWKEYLAYANKVYLVITNDLYVSKTGTKIAADCRDVGAGLLVLSPHTGFLEAKVNARHKQMEKGVKRTIVTRMAWRNGEFSARNTRRTRQYLPEE